MAVLSAVIPLYLRYNNIAGASRIRLGRRPATRKRRVDCIQSRAAGREGDLSTHAAQLAACSHKRIGSGKHRARRQSKDKVDARSCHETAARPHVVEGTILLA